MPSTFINIGSKVHVNQNDEDWGRIAHDGVVTDVGEDGCLVHFPTLDGGADVWVMNENINLRNA